MAVEEAPLLRITVVARDGRHPERLSVALRSIDGQLPKPARRYFVTDSPDDAATFSSPDLNLSP